MKFKFIKKAAMFGLDARIALAIFGALSVISGASLYSAIQEAKITSFYTEVTEVEKAIISLIIDTGLIDNSTGGYYDLRTLYKNEHDSVVGISGWKGPYLQPKLSMNDDRFSHNSLGIFAVIRRLDNNDTSACNGNVSYSSQPFSSYIVITNSDNPALCDGDISFYKKVHDKFENDGDYTSGKIHVIENGSDSTKGIFLYRIEALKVK